MRDMSTPAYIYINSEIGLFEVQKTVVVKLSPHLQWISTIS